MKTVKGKTLALVGLIISIIFSIIHLLIGFGVSSLLTNDEFLNEFKQGMLESGVTTEMLNQVLDIYKGFFSFLKGYSLFLLILGIITLVLMIMATNQKMIKYTGIALIISSIAHIVLFRLIPFGLMLAGGIMMSKYQEDNGEKPKKDDYYIDIKSNN